jgi:hypothetical protein
MLVGKSATEHTTAGTANFAPALFKLAPFPLAGALIVVLIGWLKRKQLAARPEQGDVQVVDTAETVLTSASLEGQENARPGGPAGGDEPRRSL